MYYGLVTVTEAPAEAPWPKGTILRVDRANGLRVRVTGRVDKDGSIEVVVVHGKKPEHIRNFMPDRLREYDRW